MRLKKRINKQVRFSVISLRNFYIGYLDSRFKLIVEENNYEYMERSKKSTSKYYIWMLI